MNGFLDSLNVGIEQVSASGRWLRVVNLITLIGVVAAVLSLLRHWMLHRRAKVGQAVGSNVFQRAWLLALTAAVVCGSIQAWLRYVEVNHFPSQTMGEVIVMFSLALLASMLVLHFVLRLSEFGPGWATLNDVLAAMALLGALFSNHYSLTLSTAQRDLPPALQSYWFPPHLSALITSYAMLGLAGALCVVYFSMRFWGGVFRGGRSITSQLIVLAGLVLVPFAHFITIPLLLLTGVVFLLLKLVGDLPNAQDLAGAEKVLDTVSYRAFTVGMPFLTAGLFMGAFWAQEAWANYWGWDSKENAALISWLVYAVYIHLRMLGGYRGEKAMAVLAAGALSIFVCFQVFGYLPDSQKSLHRYTDDGVTPREGQQGASQSTEQSARLEEAR